MVVKLRKSTTVSGGLYHLEFHVTASMGGSTASVLKKEFDFNRLWIKDR
jgi:S-adenosylmethionine:diacylglycerol 3-amino-3-carboxypropyl transferase